MMATNVSEECPLQNQSLLFHVFIHYDNEGRLLAPLRSAFQVSYPYMEGKTLNLLARFARRLIRELNQASLVG